MKKSNLNSLLHTDITTLLYRLCFALCPHQACWPRPDNPATAKSSPFRAGLDHREHSGGQTSPDRGVPSEPDPFQTWSACVLWGNGIFWNPVCWGPTALQASRDRLAIDTIAGEKRRPSLRKDAQNDHALGQG